MVTFDLGRSGEQLVREHQPNSKQSLIESHDSGFSFEKSPSQTRFGKPSPLANEATPLSDPLYKAKTIKKRSHPSRNIRRQFKLDSLNCSFDDSFDLNTISSVDSSKLESATENSNSLDLEEDELRQSADLTKRPDTQHDPNAADGQPAADNQTKADPKSDSKGSQRSDKKASGFLLSKEEFKKRISSESVNLPDYPDGTLQDRFEETCRKRSKSRNSKKLNKQASSTAGLSVRDKNLKNQKSSSTISLNDEQAVAKPSTTTRTISSFKNQMLDIVNSVSKSSSQEKSPDDKLSDRSSGKSSVKSSRKSSGKSNGKSNGKSSDTPKKSGDKHAIRFQNGNQRNLAENTSTVTTRSVSSLRKAYLHTAIGSENSSLFIKPYNHRHHYNG